MISKIYEILKENIKQIIIILIIILVFLIPLPYYIESPGGIDSLKTRFEIENAHEINGDVASVYVAERDGTIPNILASFILKNWDLVSLDEVRSDNETAEDENIRGKISLEQSYNNALVFASLKAKDDIEILGSKVYVTYIYENSDTTLKVGDQIISINGQKVLDRSSIGEIIETADYLKIKVLNDGKEYEREATVVSMDGVRKIGIIVDVIYDYKSNRNITYKTKTKEVGSSGGLANTLYIYASLIDEDIIKGRKIAATGTIDDEGIIGPIGGVKYKLKTVSDNNIDVFFISKYNCDEALKLKNENNYKFDLVCVLTFDEAVKYLTK